PAPWECQTQKATYKIMSPATRMSSNDIFCSLPGCVPLCRNRLCYKTNVSSNRTLSAGSGQRIVKPRQCWMERDASWHAASDAAECFATNLGSPVDTGELATTSSFGIQS